MKVRQPDAAGGQVVGSLPVVPGGLGIVEGSLAVILAAYGTGRVPAVAAALMYRLVSYWLAIAVGWLSFGIIEYQARRRRAARAGHGAAAKPVAASQSAPPASARPDVAVDL